MDPETEAFLKDVARNAMRPGALCHVCTRLTAEQRQQVQAAFAVGHLATSIARALRGRGVVIRPDSLREHFQRGDHESRQ